MRLLLFLLCFLPGILSAQTMTPDMKKVSDKYTCGACHALDTRIVGPSWKELAKRDFSTKKLGQRIRKPKPEDWPGYPPMAPIVHISDEEVKLVAEWLKTLK